MNIKNLMTGKTKEEVIQSYLNMIDGDLKYTAILEWEENGKNAWSILTIGPEAKCIAQYNADIMLLTAENRERSAKSYVITWEKYVQKLTDEGIMEKLMLR